MGVVSWVRIAVVTVSVTTAFAAHIAAQQLGGRASVSGTVVDRVDGRPIAGAHVSLSRKGGGARGTIGPLPSDRQGRFSFDGLGAGAYAVVVVADGYRPNDDSLSDGMRSVWLDVLEGENRNDVKVSLERVAKLSGTILEGGRAVSGARLFVLRRRSADRVAETVSQVTTRPDGSFDIPKLDPAPYLLAVRPRGSSGLGDLSFYQNSSRASMALWVDVVPEQHLTLPVWELQSTTSFSVTGRVVDENGRGTESAVRLVPANPWDLTDLATAEARSDARGQFAFTQVPPGDYRAEVVDFPKRSDPRGVLVPTESRGFLTGKPLSPTPAGETRWATADISVTDRDIAGVVLATEPGIRLRLQLRFTGKTPPPSPDLLSTLAIYARRLGGAPLDIPGARFEADGTATTVELPDGEYVVGLAAPIPDWTVESFRVGSADVLGRSFRLTSAEAVLSLTDASASAQGIVRTSKGFPAPGAVVYLASVDKTKWKQFGLGPTLVSSSEANRDGRYSANLVSGDYWVWAADRGSPAMSLLTEDDVARLVVGAKMVSIKPGQAASVNLVVGSQRR
jgi:5-hydroxyisourate hydrolase-like protein (transthyretin family)